MLREPEARDRAAFIELLASPEVHTYLGGPRSRGDLEREMPEVPARRPGNLVVEHDGAMIGQILLKRNALKHPAAAGMVDLGYLFLPQAWGFGYAAEACAAVLSWFAVALSDEPMMLATQTANLRSMRVRDETGFRRGGTVPGMGRRAVAWRVVIGLRLHESRAAAVVRRSILEWDVCPLGCPYLQEGF